MQFSLTSVRICLVLAGAVAVAVPAPAAEPMPAAQQDALVQKYCAVCHTDTTRNGGLSLAHFRAAQAPPSLTAMLLSKLTAGVLLKTVVEAPSNPNATAFLDKKMKSGAMGAAGIPIPDKATIDALIHAFALHSAQATDWHVERSKETVTASILREAPSVKKEGEAESYRLIASCNPATQDGNVQLAWSPIAQSGSLAASVDGAAPIQYPVEGSEKMGNGRGVVLHGLAALVLAESKRGHRSGLPFPAQSLAIGDLFPGERVTFPFGNLAENVRRDLRACFAGAGS